LTKFTGFPPKMSALAAAVGSLNVRKLSVNLTGLTSAEAAKFVSDMDTMPYLQELEVTGFPRKGGKALGTSSRKRRRQEQIDRSADEDSDTPLSQWKSFSPSPVALGVGLSVTPDRAASRIARKLP